MTTVADLAADLAAEQRALDDVVAPLTDDHWALATPSVGWTVADQIGHLTYFDRTATLAITSADEFTAAAATLMSGTAAGDPMDELLSEFRAMTPAAMLAAWRVARAALLAAATTLADDTRLPWYGPPMGAKSFLTARLMETWAHGQDVVDAVGANRVSTDRLRHIAQLGVITRGWSYAVRRATAPDVPIDVELSAPSGEVWRWGDGAAAERITGPALDFCLVVTQRRNVFDTMLEVEGENAFEWMSVAQAFAGAPTIGPPARSA